MALLSFGEIGGNQWDTRWKLGKAAAVGLKINTPHRRSGLIILTIGSGAEEASPGSLGAKP